MRVIPYIPQHSHVLKSLRLGLYLGGWHSMSFPQGHWHQTTHKYKKAEPVLYAAGRIEKVGPASPMRTPSYLLESLLSRIVATASSRRCLFDCWSFSTEVFQPIWYECVWLPTQSKTNRPLRDIHAQSQIGSGDQWCMNASLQISLIFNWMYLVSQYPFAIILQHLSILGIHLSHNNFIKGIDYAPTSGHPFTGELDQ